MEAFFKKIWKLFIWFSCILHTQYGISQTYQQNINDFFIKLEIKDSNIKGKSEGEKLLEFHNYDLFQIISEITKTPIQYFILNGNASNPKASLKIETKGNINKETLIHTFLIFLQNNLNIEYNWFYKERPSFVLKIPDFSKITTCSTETIERSFQKINRTVNIKCMELKVLKDIIYDLYTEHIYLSDDIPINTLVSLSLFHFNNFEDFLADLRNYKDIHIIQDNRSVKHLYLNFL